MTLLILRFSQIRNLLIYINELTKDERIFYLRSFLWLQKGIIVDCWMFHSKRKQKTGTLNTMFGQDAQKL